MATASETFPGPLIMEKINRIAPRLLSLKLTVSTAESLTGGLIAAALTSFPGSSEYFILGVTAYSNEAKRNILSVPEEIFRLRGAVSHECSAAMADNVRALAKTALSLSSTGIAGPGGATDLKPVGLVYLSVSGEAETITAENIFRGSRHEVACASVSASLELLESYLDKRAQ